MAIDWDGLQVKAKARDGAQYRKMAASAKPGMAIDWDRLRVKAKAQDGAQYREIAASAKPSTRPGYDAARERLSELGKAHTGSLGGFTVSNIENAGTGAMDYDPSRVVDNSAEIDALRQRIAGLEAGKWYKDAAAREERAAEANYRKWTGLDTGEAERTRAAKEAERAEAQRRLDALELTARSSNALGAFREELEAARGQVDSLDAELRLLNQDIKGAGQVQELLRYYAYMAEPDFARLAAAGEAVENPARTRTGAAYGQGTGTGAYAWQGGAPANPAKFARENRSGDEGAYSQMTDEEYAIYNYLLAKEGLESAEAFHAFLREQLAARSGEETGRAVRDIDSGLLRTLATGAYGLTAGVDQFAGGVRQFFSGEEQPVSALQYGSQYIREDLGKSGNKLGQLAYDTTTTLGNMAPSVLLGAMTGGFGVAAGTAGAAGSAALGLSAAGNAYGQALAAGYGRDEARVYSTLVGAAEGGLQYLLGGVSKLGGKVSAGVMQKVRSIDSALLRAAATLGTSIASEITEEELQLFLEPLLRATVFGEEYDAPTVEDMVYTALVTALSTGALEGGNAVRAGLRGGAAKQALDTSAATDENAAPGVEAAGKAQNGIVPFSEQEIANLSSAKGIVAGNGTTFRQFIDSAKSLGNTVRYYFGKVSQALGSKIEQATGADVSEYNIAMRSDEVAHALSQHGNAATEAMRGQLPVTPEALSRLPEVLSNPDDIVLLPKRDYAGRTAFEMRKQLDGYMVAVVGIATGRHSIEVDSVYIINKKNGTPTTVDATQNASPDLTPETGSGQSQSTDNIPKPAGTVKTDLAEGSVGAAVDRGARGRYNPSAGPEALAMKELARVMERAGDSPASIARATGLQPDGQGGFVPAPTPQTEAGKPGAEHVVQRMLAAGLAEAQQQNAERKAQEQRLEESEGAVDNSYAQKDTSGRPRHYSRSRPAYAKGQVAQVWENAKNAETGKVYDPTGEEIVWNTERPRNGQWDMGHIPGQQYEEVHRRYMDGLMTKEEFLAWYRYPDHYRPELPRTNRGHAYETQDGTDFQMLQGTWRREQTEKTS